MISKRRHDVQKEGSDEGLRNDIGEEEETASEEEETQRKGKVELRRRVLPEWREGRDTRKGRGPYKFQKREGGLPLFSDMGREGVALLYQKRGIEGFSSFQKIGVIRRFSREIESKEEKKIKARS